MKNRIKPILLVCILLLSFVMLLTSCTGNTAKNSSNDSTKNNDKNNNSSLNDEEHTHAFGSWMDGVYPTCTETGSKMRKCKCGEYEIEKVPAKGHQKSNTGLCSVCAEPYSRWIIQNFVDEFQNSTKETYIRNVSFSGKFSNSATTNSSLKVDFIITDKDISIVLLEYDDKQVKAYSKTNYSVSVLDGKGTKHAFKGVMYKGGDRVVITDRSLISLMLNNSSLEFYLQDDSSYPSTYLFTYTKENLGDIYTLSKEEEPVKEGTYTLQLSGGAYVTSEARYVTTPANVRKELLGMSDNIANATRWKVVKNSDGSISLMSGTKYLYADGEDVMLVANAGEHTSFITEERSGGVLIKCKNATYNGNPQYLEVYYDGCLTCYGLNEENIGIYTFKFVEAGN